MNYVSVAATDVVMQLIEKEMTLLDHVTEMIHNATGLMVNFSPTIFDPTNFMPKRYLICRFPDGTSAKVVSSISMQDLEENFGDTFIKLLVEVSTIKQARS